MHLLKNKKILITCGPTWTPIDQVRVISNTSTGALGQIIAKDLAKTQAKVTLLEGAVLHPLTSKRIKVKKFLFYEELFQLIKQQARKKYDIVVHTAAVSDYKIKKYFNKKISSNLKELTLKLKPTQKIISLFKKYYSNTFLVGFKLESHMSRALAVRQTKDLFKKTQCDLIIANSVNKNKYCGYILNNKGKILSKATSRPMLSKNLIQQLQSQASMTHSKSLI